MTEFVLATQMFKTIALVIGFLTIYLGYVLLKMGVTGKFKFSFEMEGKKADLRSVSPGLLFVLLGSILCVVAVVTQGDYNYSRTKNGVTETVKSTSINGNDLEPAGVKKIELD